MSEGNLVSTHLSFLRSACGTAEGAIRLADEKVGYTLLVLGILVASLSLRADRLLSVLIAPDQSLALRALLVAGAAVFLGAAGVSFVYALRSRSLSVDPPTDVPSTLSHLASLKLEGLVEELGRALYQRAEIAGRKLTLLRRCLIWAVAALASWAWVLLISLVA
ncbi:MAG TPA: hypothetical protein VLM91_07230 [Candidatus Methylomirabilis sp.]|nr:hypothetical protein [Candidatus Methylomirabilis sp.]